MPTEDVLHLIRVSWWLTGGQEQGKEQYQSSSPIKNEIREWLVAGSSGGKVHKQETKNERRRKHRPRRSSLKKIPPKRNRRPCSVALQSSKTSAWYRGWVVVVVHRRASHHSNRIAFLPPPACVNRPSCFSCGQTPVVSSMMKSLPPASHSRSAGRLH